MKKLVFLIIFLCQSLWAMAQADTTSIMPTRQELDRAIDIFWNKTSCKNLTAERLEAMAVVQRAADRFSEIEYRAYRNGTDETVLRDMEQSGIIWYHKAALDKIIAELQTERVPENGVVIWQLYNMGYIIKTPTSCFAIDISHRRAEALIPYIDFLLVTHKHGDHYTLPFFAAMEKAGKSIVSNFHESGILATDGGILNFGDITIKTGIADHNTRLRNFVVTYEIDCGPKAGNCIIFHIGDTFNADQLHPSRPVDFLIPHVEVGLDMPKAVQNTHAKAVLMSHILELSHARHDGGYRWSYKTGLAGCEALDHPNAWLPVWGEKIVWQE